MAKKLEVEEVVDEVVEEVVESKPAAVTADFHREDLNQLRDVANYLLRKS